MSEIRIGIVGAGSMGRAHAAAVGRCEGATLAAVCDPHPDRRRALADRTSAVAFADLAEMLDAGLDAVVVATPEAHHLAPALASLEAGLHVLVEKPLTTDVTEAHRLAEAAARTGLCVLPGFNLRFSSDHQDVHAWLKSGAAGSITSLSLRRNRPASLFETYQRVHPGHESTSHDIDLMLWLTGGRVRSVFARERHREDEQNPYGVWALMELDDGTVVSTESIWSLPGEAGVPKDDVLEVVGSDGTAHLDVARGTLTYWDGRGVTETMLGATSAPGFVAIDAEIRQFVAAISSGEPPETASLADAVHVVEVVDAMIRSAAAAAPVLLEP